MSLVSIPVGMELGLRVRGGPQQASRRREAGELVHGNPGNRSEVPKRVPWPSRPSRGNPSDGLQAWVRGETGRHRDRLQGCLDRGAVGACGRGTGCSGRGPGGQRATCSPSCPKTTRTFGTFEINQTFGGLDVAIVGIEVDDAYAPSVAQPLEATEALQALPDLERPQPDQRRRLHARPHGGHPHGQAVAALPDLHGVAGARSAGGRAGACARHPCEHGRASPRGLRLHDLRRRDPGRRGVGTTQSQRPFPTRRCTGAALPSSAPGFEATQSDLARLTPWAVLAIGLCWSPRPPGHPARAGLHGDWHCGEPGADGGLFRAAQRRARSMLIILFAGSAYAIHVLTRYQAHRQELSCVAALEDLVHTGPRC